MERLAADGQYLASRKLCQVGFELLTNHRVDSHQTEHTGLANAALCVVIALRRDRGASGIKGAYMHTYTHTHTHPHEVSKNVGGVAKSAEYTQTFPGTNKANNSHCPNMNIVQISLCGTDTDVSALSVLFKLSTPATHLKLKTRFIQVSEM